jgi:hypothetical protein
MLLDFKRIACLIAGLLLSLTTWADKIHDPTRPALNVVVSSADGSVRFQSMQSEESLITLQGVLNKKGTMTAIIDGQLVHKGDMFKGFKVSQIETNYVVLAKGSTVKRLFVYE